MSQRYELPRFKKALEAFAGQLPAVTRWRYSNGILPPPFGPLIIDNPDLAQALADDAAELAAALAAKTGGVELIVAGADTEQEESK